MTHLLLAVVSSTIFQQLFRCLQRRQRDVTAVGAVNYLAAAVIMVAWWRLGGGEGWSWSAGALGAINGTFYWLHLLVVLAAFHLVGVGVTSALVGCSSVIPVLWSWSVWNDPMTAWRWTALALTPLAMLLIRPGRHTLAGELTGLTWRADLTLLLVFAIGGIISVIHKDVQVRLGESGFQAYQATLFTVAALTSTWGAWLGRRSCQRLDLALGALIGVFNLAVTVLLLLALAAVPATVVFPTYTTLIIALNLALSRMLWSERPARRQYLGLAAAVAVVVLVNL